MEETEHALYNRVRAAEMQRRKQEQDVQRLFNEMESLTKENDKRMKVNSGSFVSRYKYSVSTQLFLSYSFFHCSYPSLPPSVKF